MLGINTSRQPALAAAKESLRRLWLHVQSSLENADGYCAKSYIYIYICKYKSGIYTIDRFSSLSNSTFVWKSKLLIRSGLR